MNKLLKNWSYLLFSDLFQQFAGFYVIILIARNLSPSGLGEYNLVISIASIFSIVAIFGSSNVIVREIAVNIASSKVFIKKMLIPVRLFTLLLSLVTFFAYNFFGFNSEYFLLIIIIVLNASLFNFSESIAFGNEVTKFSASLNFFYSLTWLIIILIIPSHHFYVKNILIVYCFLHFIKMLFYLVITYRYFYNEEKFLKKKSSMKFMGLLKMCIPYAWLFFLGVLCLEIPIQFLAHNSNLDEVGFYSLSLKLMIPISIAITTGFKAIFPSLTKLKKSNEKEFKNFIVKSFNAIILFGTLVAIFSSLTSNYFIQFVFGAEYQKSSLVFNFLIWYSVIRILDTLVSNSLSAAYKENITAILGTIDIIILLPLIYYASSFGAVNVSIVMLFSGVCFLLYHLVVLSKSLKIKFLNRNFIMMILFYLISLAICLYLPDNFFKLLSILAVILFFVAVKNSPFKSIAIDISKQINYKQ